MSAYYTILLLIGSGTLYAQGRRLLHSIKTGNRSKAKADAFFIGLSLLLLVGLVWLSESKT